MAWKIEFSDTALRQLEKLDKSVARRILRFFQDRVVSLDNPRTIGQALKGEQMGEFWRYRIGDYRAIASIQDDRVVVLVLRIGHRREIYR